jgi:hypothetical protein
MFEAELGYAQAGGLRSADDGDPSLRCHRIAPTTVRWPEGRVQKIEPYARLTK